MTTTARKVPFYRTVDGLIVPGSYEDDKVRSALIYKPKPGDLFVTTYPKCGTTWTQYIVYLICSGGNPPESVAEFRKMNPYLELNGTDSVDKSKSFYAIKTHLPFHRNPYSSQAKYIYVTRNPKDVVVSYYHHARAGPFNFEDGEFDVLFDLFMEAKMEYGDYFDHVLGWYEHRLDNNVLFLTYEDLKADTKAVVLKIARFMGKMYLDKLENDPQVVENILKYSSVEEMKEVLNVNVPGVIKNASSTEGGLNSLSVIEGNSDTDSVKKLLNSKEGPVRAGVTGGWRNVLSKEQNERMDSKIKANLIGTDLYEKWENVLRL